MHIHLLYKLVLAYHWSQDYFALKREKNKPLSRESIKVRRLSCELLCILHLVALGPQKKGDLSFGCFGMESRKPPVNTCNFQLFAAAVNGLHDQNQTGLASEATWRRPSFGRSRVGMVAGAQSLESRLRCADVGVSKCL